VILEQHFPHWIANAYFWWDFLVIKDNLPLLADVHQVLFDHRPQSVLHHKVICSYDFWIFFAVPDDHPLKIDEPKNRLRCGLSEALY